MINPSGVPSASQLIQGTICHLSGNQPICLTNPEIIWIVESGSIALFAMTDQPSLLEGSRRHLCTVQTGQALFSTSTSTVGLALGLAEHPQQIVAISMGEVTLLQVSRRDFQQFLDSGQPQAVKWVEGWVNELGGILSELLPPQISTMEEGVQYFSLAKGEVFQSRQTVTWVQLQSGVACFMDFPDLSIEPDPSWFPLSSQTWIRSETNLELGVITTPDILQDLKDRHLTSEILLVGIAQLQTYFLHSISLISSEESQTEVDRFQQRQRLNQQVMTDTLADLVALVQTHDVVVPPTPILDRQDALLMAAGAVGRTLGVTICPPAKSEDLHRVTDPLEAIARSSRLRTRRITLQGKWWKKDCGPLLAYTKDDHPVALLPKGSDRYELFDPRQAHRISLTAKRAASLSPMAYMFYRPLPNHTLKTWELMRFALKGHAKELIMVIFAGIAMTVLGMVTPQATAILIDNAIPDADRHLLVQIAFGLSATALGSLVFQLTQGFAIMRVETFADASTQSAVWDRLLKLNPTFFRQYPVGDLNSRVSAVSEIRQKLSSTVLKTVFSSLFSLLNLGLLFYYNSGLAAIAVVVALVNIGVTFVSGILTLKKVEPLLELQGQLFGVMVQLINNVTKLRVAGAESRAFAYWGKQYHQQVKLMQDTQSIDDMVTVINQVIPTITTAILFYIATEMLQQSQTQGGSFSTGTFLAFNTAFGTFVSGATSLSNTAIDLLQVVPLWNRAQPILEAKPEVDTTKADPGRLMGKLVVDHAIFRYRNDGPLTLDDVSIQASPGEFIAFVGGSGSGKTTLFRLLLGFDQPESGTIYYDGQDLAGLDVQAVRRQLGVVMQNSRVMSASIFDNIASGAQVTMDEAWSAAHMAGFAEDIESMPMGMHTVVSEGGTNLSGGQRQRLLIARALVLRPKILLFDEATSALDNRTQAIVSQSLERLQVTRIVIAHRLSTIRNADRIYVFQAGRIVQQGHFEHLANQPGLFAQLMARQQL